MFPYKHFLNCYRNLRIISVNFYVKPDYFKHLTKVVSFPFQRCFSVTSTRNEKFRNIDEVIPENLYGYQNGILQKENGQVYDSKPFKLTLEKGKTYSWCLCGYSKSQPLCDRTHKIDELQIKLRPIFFKVAETKDYWICNCKQTKHRPFCDGSHIEIQRKEEEAEREKAERIARLKEES